MRALGLGEITYEYCGAWDGLIVKSNVCIFSRVAVSGFCEMKRVEVA